MKYYTLIASAALLMVAACSSQAGKIEKEINKKEILETNFLNYFRTNLSSEEQENMQINSVSVIDIDTLTEKAFFKMQRYALVPEFEKWMSLVKDDMFQIDNAKYLKFDAYMIEDFKEDLRKDRESLKKVMDKSEYIKSRISHADSIRFKYYLVTLDVHYRQKGAVDVTRFKLPASIDLEPVNF